MILLAAIALVILCFAALLADFEADCRADERTLQ